jgi:hypothetical protein
MSMRKRNAFDELLDMINVMGVIEEDILRLCHINALSVTEVTGLANILASYNHEDIYLAHQIVKELCIKHNIQDSSIIKNNLYEDKLSTDPKESPESSENTPDL